MLDTCPFLPFFKAVRVVLKLAYCWSIVYETQIWELVMSVVRCLFLMFFCLSSSDCDLLLKFNFFSLPMFYVTCVKI